MKSEATVPMLVPAPSVARVGGESAGAGAASVLDRPAPRLFEVIAARGTSPLAVAGAVLPAVRRLLVQQFLLVGHGRLLNEAEATRQPTFEVPIPLPATAGCLAVSVVRDLVGLGVEQTLLRRGPEGWDVLSDTDVIDLRDASVEYRAAKTAWSS